MSKASPKVLTIAPISVAVGNGRNVLIATEGSYHINSLNEAGEAVDASGFNTILHTKVAEAVAACAAEDASWFESVEHIGSGEGQSPRNHHALANIFETLKKNTGVSNEIMVRVVEDVITGLQKVIDDRDGARERWMRNVRLSVYSADKAVDCGIDTTADVYVISYSVDKRAALFGDRFITGIRSAQDSYNPTEE